MVIDGRIKLKYGSVGHLVGIFVGPVVLAVTYTLLENWVLDGERRANG
jgi:predicted PurR-regulated permease PerM